ncbi:uncharacterized protein isoform X1 [Macaca fascicularis]|uniref:uncharacterized protein isoform X1 n=1 Tax=Macaca fascicularis TaxID=9541 RepID=UPI0032B04717
MRDWGPFVQPCGWAEAQPMPQGKLLLANPSRGPFKKGWCFSLARGTPPACIPLEAETALRARFQQQQQLRGQSEVRRSGGGFYVTVEEEAGLGGSTVWLQMMKFHSVFLAEEYSIRVHPPQLLYPFICGWTGFSTWLQMTRFHPFLWLKNIPFWMNIAVSSSLHQWMKRIPGPEMQVRNWAKKNREGAERWSSSVS